MGVKDILPRWMFEGTPERQVATPEVTPAATPPSAYVPPPIIVGGTAQPADQSRVEAIVAEIVAAVPELKALFDEADKIKDRVPDTQTRLGIVMSLKGINPQGAAGIVAGLERTVKQVQVNAEAELQEARRDQIEGPTRQIGQKEARKQVLSEEMRTLDHEIGELRQSVETATQNIARATGQFHASLTQVQAWVKSTAAQLGVQQQSN